MRVSMRATTLCGFIRASSEEQTRHPMRGTRGPVATARRSASVATTSGGTMGRDSNLSSQSGAARKARGSRVRFKERAAVEAVEATTAPPQPLLLPSEPDRYGGVLVDSSALPSDASQFQQALEHSLRVWRSQGVMGVWIKVPRDKVALVPVATEAGFDFHHAETGHVMMNFWLPDDVPTTLPACGATQLGVGAFVLNENREVLVVSEKRGPAAKTDFRLYKLPTGLVDLGEDVPDAAQREVREETGIDTEFVAVLGMRHAHQVAFGRGDMFFLCALRPVGDRTINMCDTELIDAKWMPLDDFVNPSLNQHIKPNTEMAYLYELCVQFADGQRAGLEVHQCEASLSSNPARVPPYMYANRLCAHGSPIARSRRVLGKNFSAFAPDADNSC